MQSGPPGPASHSYFSQRLRLHYVDWGNESAPALVLLHGGSDHCRSWDWVAQELRDAYHVVAPDLRGHGDSQWAIGSSYPLIDLVFDLAQLIDQQDLAPVRIIGHSRGAAVGLQYAGLYPTRVQRIVAVEGVGRAASADPPPPEPPAHERIRAWVHAVRDLAGRRPRRYETLEAAIARMQDANPRLSAEQARHLTIHGANQNEDGSYTWKFDNYARDSSRYPASPAVIDALWERITCPTLLISGAESWAGDPMRDERGAHFGNARSVCIERAGHWVHHDRLDAFLPLVREFLAE